METEKEILNDLLNIVSEINQKARILLETEYEGEDNDLVIAFDNHKVRVYTECSDMIHSYVRERLEKMGGADHE